MLQFGFFLGHLQGALPLSFDDPADEVEPGEHDWQELPSLYLLAGHLQSYTLPDPADELEPEGHVLQLFGVP